MIRALWFMLKLAVLIAAAVFLASQPGEMSLHWGAYKIQLALGLFLAGLFVLILIALSVYRLLRAIADIPGFFARRAQITRRDKAYQSLAQGLSAVAAGDARMAVKMSKRVQGLLEDHGGLPLLLEAQAARLEGREDEALNLFLQLADSKEAGFLGIRGLLAAALERGDSVRALSFARRGLEMHPRQPWLLQMTLDLEIQSRDFDSALKTLKKAERAGSLPLARIRALRQAIGLFEGERLARQGHGKAALAKYREAYNWDKSFAPAAVMLAEAYMESGQRRQAVAVLERCWKLAPHPDIAVLWGQLAPKGTAGSPPKMIAWVQRLIKPNPAHPESLLLLARTAGQCGLWGEAREDLRKIEASGEADRRVYELWARLEGLSEDERAELAVKTSDALLPRSWICSKTGALYGRWEPIAEPHGAFASMVWERPGTALLVGADEPVRQIGFL